MSLHFSMSFPLRLAGTLLLAWLAAQACQALHMPLPWMLGPLVAVSALSMAGAPTAQWAPLREWGHWVIGTALGLYFTPQVVALVASKWWAIALGIVWAFVLGLAFGAFLRWMNRAQIASLGGLQARATIYCASTIGGTTEMVTLAEKLGGRADLVTAAHTLRLMVVVLLIPLAVTALGLRGIDASLPGAKVVALAAWPGFAGLALLTLAAALLMQWRKLANPWMMGPMLASIVLTATGHEWSAMPPVLSNAAQLFIGASLGARFTPAFAHHAPRWMASVLLGVLAMLVACAGFAWVLAQWTGLHPVSVMLGTSPGGITEMAITAKVLQLGVPIVTAFHVTRMATVVLLAQPAFYWIERWQTKLAREPN